MVYCTKCGTNNADSATVCVQCGAPLHGTSGEARPYTGPGTHERKYGFHRRGAPLVGLIIGVIVIFIGLSFLLREFDIFIPWWEIILILVGIYLFSRLFSVW